MNHDKTAEEKRELFRRSRHEEAKTEITSKYAAFERKEIKSIQRNLDSIDEKIYTIRKRIDTTTDLYESVRYMVHNTIYCIKIPGRCYYLYLHMYM